MTSNSNVEPILIIYYVGPDGVCVYGERISAFLDICLVSSWQNVWMAGGDTKTKPWFVICSVQVQFLGDTRALKR